MKIWKDRLRKFLKFLSLLSQIWQEISIDFIIDFLESDGYIVIIVVIDRLSKDVIIKSLKNITIKIII